MKHYNTDYTQAANSIIPDNHNYKKEQGLQLAYAIWYVELCRFIRMPNRLQIRILRCCNGSRNIWSCDINKIISRIVDYPQYCQDCFYRSSCIELSSREQIFLSNRLKDFFSAWSDCGKRISAAKLAEQYQGRDIFALDVTDALYPANLLQISGNPAVLFCEGEGMEYLNNAPLRITIVGTREPTPYGVKATEIITRVLADHDCAIISGLAKGVDAIVHKITISRQGFTAAVTAGGTDIYYPYQNKQLQQTISDRGVIISEHPPGTKPIKQYFPARNRILSGIADVIIVTESPEHSGTLITTSFASDQDREVYAIPGNIIQETSRGCNRLIIDGAALLDDPVQIIDRYKLQLRRIKQHVTDNGQTKPDNGCALLTEMTAHERIVIKSLSSHAMNIDQLVLQTKMPVDQIAAIVTGLELKNRIGRKKGQYFLTYE